MRGVPLYRHKFLFILRNYDASQLKASTVSSKRYQHADVITKEYIHNKEVYYMEWYRYYFTFPINHGLSRSPDCFPPNTVVSIRLQRAPSSFALLKLAETIKLTHSETSEQIDVPYSYPESVIPITHPILSTYFAYSNNLERNLGGISTTNVELSYLDGQARQTILDGGLANFDIDLLTGKLPKYIIFSFSSIERLTGSEELALTKFEQGDLEIFDLQLDRESITGFPLTGRNNAAIDYYKNYLQQTNRYD